MTKFDTILHMYVFADESKIQQLITPKMLGS